MLGIDDIVRIFEEIELRLIGSLKRNLSRHKDEEQQESFNWSAWQAEKLRSLDRFRRENAQIMGQYTDLIDDATRQIMQEEFEQGVNGSDTVGADTILPNVTINGADGRIISAPTAEFQREPDFFGIDDTKVKKLIGDVTYLEKNAETAALRMTDDVYRQTVNRVQLAMSVGEMTLQQAIDSAVKDFLAQGINCIVYKDGRRVNIADYVRMALRTTATRATLQGKSARFKALGCDTVLVDSHGMCSKTCEPWQGRVYIEDTFSMWDGEVREQGGILWGKSNYCGKWFPLLSSAIEKGLFHPNCRHSIGLWRDGDPLPESVDNTDSERRYKLEQQQRALERAVRRAKRKAEGFTDPANIKKAKAELKQAQKALRDFIAKVNADEGATVLKRDSGKETVYEGEVKKTEPNALTNFLNDDTIADKEEEFKKRVKAGAFKTEIEPKKQQKHIYGKAWKNQVKQAIRSFSDPDPKNHHTPKSVFSSKYDPQKLIDKYCGTGMVEFSNDGKSVNEYILLKHPIGRTYDKKIGRYILTKKLQIKYCDNGTHVFPIVER